MTYEDLLIKSDVEGLIVKEKAIKGNDGRIKGKRIAIRKDLNTTAEKSCVLAEELGHHYTSSGNILSQSDTMNRKQEYRARLYGYNLKVGLMGIVRAYENGCRNIYEMAEFLECTEEYLQEALSAYHRKYGVCYELDNYIIFFEPHLAVLRKFAV
ncbi:MAG: hypothetical protein Q4C77_10420 [Eubacteriales bacterium]|nr:hypothetical protein [Eubacteriales bacterium]